MDTLAVNNIHALVSANATLWWNGAFSFVEVGGEDGLNLDMVGGLWLAGRGPDGDLRLAAQGYEVAAGQSDFWPGQLDTSTGTTAETTCENFDQLWKVQRADIENHLQD